TLIKDGARVTIDLVAVIPYSLYYSSYEAAKYILSAGSKLGPVGKLVARVIAAALVPAQAAGLLGDAAFDKLKRERVGDKGARGYINPLHSFLPGPLKGPKTYLPGIHADGK